MNMQLVHATQRRALVAHGSRDTHLKSYSPGLVLCRGVAPTSAAAPVDGLTSRAADPKQTGTSPTSEHISFNIARQSSHTRFTRTRASTLSLPDVAVSDYVSTAQQLPLSHLAFKALLRASLAAARMNHTRLTTPHLVLGLLSTAAAAASPLAAAAQQYAAAEAAVRAIIDGPGTQASPAAAAAAAAGDGQTRISGGLQQGMTRFVSGCVTNGVSNVSCDNVVRWCGDLSDRVRDVIRAAEQHTRQQGHDLITTDHLLSAILHQEIAAAADNGAPMRIHTMLTHLGLQLPQIAKQSHRAQQQQRQRQQQCDEDAVCCEPSGVLHEEFYSSLCRSISPGQPPAQCLN